MDVTFSPALRVNAEMWEIAGRRRAADAQFAQALAHIRSGTPDAMYVMLTFLEVNGIHMECTNEEVVEVGLSVASGTMDYDSLLQWVRDHRILTVLKEVDRRHAYSFNYNVVISAPSRGLTQNRDPNVEKAGGYRRTQWIAHRAESTQKRRKALRHNAFRRSSYLHTQEVTGSSPAVSTKKFLIS